MVYQGNIPDIESGRFYFGKISISEDKIISIEKISDEISKSQPYIIPPFIDSHIHIESSLLSPSEFGSLVSKHGTFGVVADPHEIANVSGVDGVKKFYQNGLNSPIKIYWSVPSTVPASQFEGGNSKLDLEDQKDLFRIDSFVSLGEVMNVPSVLSRDSEIMDKIKDTISLKRVVDGHAPTIDGEDLKSYFSTGISTDHESSTFEEGEKKIKQGVMLQIREGSAAKNFDQLIELVDKYPDSTMFCSDDLHPDYLLRGHINLLFKRGIEKGIDPIKLIKTSSINPINHYKLDIGKLKVDDDADFLIIDNLVDLNIVEKIYKGRKLEENLSKPITPFNNYYINKIETDDIRVPFNDSSDKGIRVIEAMDGELLTNLLELKPKVVDGFAVSDLERDIIKVVVLNRYEVSRPVIGFIKGFKIESGAFATTIAHDAHNIIAIGSNDEDIIRSIDLLHSGKGGVAISSKTKKLENYLPLEICGLVSTLPYNKLIERYSSIFSDIRSITDQFNDPLMTLSFISLSVIPSIKITAKGLIDVDKFRLTNLIIKK